MKKLAVYLKPLLGIVLVNLIGFALLYLYKDTYDLKIIYIGLALTISVCLMYFFILRRGLGDEILFLVCSMLISLGLIMLFRLDREVAAKQVLWLSVGIIVLLVSYFAVLKLEFWDKLGYHYIGLSILLFLITLVFGKDVRGANNWIIIGSFSIQPSEIIKILYIFFIAAYCTKPETLDISGISIGKYKLGINNRIVFTGVVYVYLGFLVLQREWGTALLFFTIFFCFMYICGHGYKALLLNMVIACAGAAAGYFLLYHIRVRVDMWLNPWKDIADKGYQITQSLFAIGAGGFFGSGIGMGRPDLIPEVYTDFIFSAICEEMGIFGGIAVILLYFILVYRGIKIALTVKETFFKLVAFGITIMFGFQTFIIIGGVIKLIPLTGITLPFISYGGSSLTASFISLGLLLAISKRAY